MSDQLCHYELFALRLASEIELPELFPTTAGEADVQIKRGKVAPIGSVGEVDLAQVGDGVTVQVRGIARFHIRQGNEIVVEGEPAVDPRKIRVFLLGTACGVLIQQRGLLPLHANAIELGSKAVAFSGESGAGKSTLAAWFHDRGARIIADDVCVIGFGHDEEPQALPGLPRFRLWRDAVERSGRTASDHSRSFGVEDACDKYDVSVAPTRALRLPLPLGTICILERGDRFRSEQLAGVDAVTALFEHTYRGAHLPLTGGHARHWKTCVRLAADVPIFRMTRQWGAELIDNQNMQLLAALGLGGEMPERIELAER